MTWDLLPSTCGVVLIEERNQQARHEDAFAFCRDEWKGHEGLGQHSYSSWTRTAWTGEAVPVEGKAKLTKCRGHRRPYSPKCTASAWIEARHVLPQGPR